MTYIVKDECIKCKLMDCVDVCPVDCFYEGENMLVIHPDECIDCGVCEPECPIDAIHSDTEDGMEVWAELNRKYSEIWPVITEKKQPPSDAKDWEGVKDKYKNNFSELFDKDLNTLFEHFNTDKGEYFVDQYLQPSKINKNKIKAHGYTKTYERIF